MSIYMFMLFSQEWMDVRTNLVLFTFGQNLVSGIDANNKQDHMTFSYIGK